jgi:hypothetical protein
MKDFVNLLSYLKRIFDIYVVLIFRLDKIFFFNEYLLCQRKKIFFFYFFNEI